MLTLLKSFVISLLDNSCNPWKAKDIQASQAIQRTFTCKIPEVQRLTYWARLHELKLYSLQRRHERYNYNHNNLEDNTAYGAKY